jgi:hypothetical protein
MNRTQWLNQLESANFFGTDENVPTIRAMFDNHAPCFAEDLDSDAMAAECERSMQAAVAEFNLYQQIIRWRDENPDTAGIWPKVDLDTMTVVGTQDAHSSWSGGTNDTSDWEVLYLGAFIEDVAVRVTP